MNTALAQNADNKIATHSAIAKLIQTHQEALRCQLLYSKLQTGVINEKETAQLRPLEQAIADIIAVDDFPAHAFSRA